MTQSTEKVTPKLRQYQPIWEELKKKKICKVVCHKSFMALTVRMVKKEKLADLGFKLEQDEVGKVSRIKTKVKGGMIEFRLIDNVTLADL